MSGLPNQLKPADIERSLQGVAQATLESRHPGPRKDVNDNMAILAAPALKQVSAVENHVVSRTKEPLPTPRPQSPEMVDLTTTGTEYDPYNPYYKGTSADVERVNFIKRTERNRHPAVAQLTQMPVRNEKFQLRCDQCSFATMETSDGAALSGLVAYLAHHKDTAHKAGDNSDSTTRVGGEANRAMAEVEAFQKTITPVTIPAAKDDRVSQFTEGRWLMGPIGWGSLLTQAPLVQKPYGHMDLWHLGIQYVDPRIVNPLHNRVARGLDADKFACNNLNKRDKRKRLEPDEHGFIEGLKYEESNEWKDLLVGAFNYYELMREIHPYDFGPRAMFRVLLEHCLYSETKTPESLKKFFVSITEANASRACTGKPSLTYKECLVQWNRVNPNFPKGSAEAAAEAKKRKDDAAKDAEAKAMAEAVVAHLPNILGQARPMPPMRRGQDKPNKKSRKSSGGPWCKFFNKGTCPNTKSGQGCIGPNGVEYIHSCDVRSGPGSRCCGKRDHSALTHV